VLTALVFAAGGLGLFSGQAWWRPAAVIAAILSSAIFILFWDGKFKELDSQGGVGLLLNLAILVVVLVLNLPV